MQTSSKKKLSKKEIVWYSISGFIALAGLFFLILGIVGDHLPVVYSDNWILYSEPMWLSNWSGLSYRTFGLILFLIGSLLAVICLAVFAREGDRDAERALRRAQRLGVAPVEQAKTEDSQVK